MAKKYVYFFGAGKADGKSEMKDLLGGKGATLAEMGASTVIVDASARASQSSTPAFSRSFR